MIVAGDGKLSPFERADYYLNSSKKLGLLNPRTVPEFFIFEILMILENYFAKSFPTKEAPHVIIACRVMKPEIDSLVGTAAHIELRYLDASLHETPDRMPQLIQDQIDKENARFLDKKYEEIPGLPDYFKKITFGPYLEKDFICLKPGETMLPGMGLGYP